MFPGRAIGLYPSIHVDKLSVVIKACVIPFFIWMYHDFKNLFLIFRYLDYFQFFVFAFVIIHSSMKRILVHQYLCIW